MVEVMKLKYAFFVLLAPLFCFSQNGLVNGGSASTSFNAPSYLEISMEEDKEIAEENVEEVEEAIGMNGFFFQVFDAGVNTEYSDYGGTFFMEKFIMYSSKKIGLFGNGKNEGTDEYSTTLYCTNIEQNGDLDRPLLFSRFITSKENQGSVAFTPDEKTIYFTESPRENHKVYSLYKMEMHPEQKGVWMNKKKITFVEGNYSIENPHITADGKTLYFASNMPGTTGGFDIFSAPILEDGTLGNPQPVKGSVNTEQDEKFPYTSKSGDHLYFSSTGHRSFGGYDVFVSRIVKDTHKRPRNLGSSLNSNKDDISFIPASKTKGFLTSNRNEGKGGFDVYKTNLFLVDQVVTGRVLDLETNAPLANATVKLYDEEGTEVATVKADERAAYKFDVEPYEIHTIVAEKEGFSKRTVELDVFNGRHSKFSRNLLLAPKQSSIIKKDDKLMIALDNIYFDYDKSSIKEESKATLDKVAAILMAHPKLNIEIEAHTDSQGDDAYNMKLSEERAAATKNYLVSKGVNAERLKAKGFGETKPISACTSCTEADHQQNRRIEFIIVE